MKYRMLGLCAVALGMLLGSPAAFAQSNNPGSPLDTLAKMHTRPYEFLLESRGDSQTYNYSRTRHIRICIQPYEARPKPQEETAAGTSLTIPAEPVPLDVKYDGGDAKVDPGQCLRVATQHVTVSPAAPLNRSSGDSPAMGPQNPALRGTIQFED